MKKNILSFIIVGLLASGCASNDQPSEIVKKPKGSITFNDSGTISDEVSIMSISEDNYLNDMKNILTEDGYSMKIEDLSPYESSSVKNENTIYFSFDSSKITDEMKKVIDIQILFLKKYPKIKVILEGHTDEKGSNSYNVVLGEKRANEIKKILTESGISTSQIEVISYGEMKPLLTGSTEKEHSKNRRAVFIYQ